MASPGGDTIAKGPATPLVLDFTMVDSNKDEGNRQRRVQSGLLGASGQGRRRNRERHEMDRQNVSESRTTAGTTEWAYRFTFFQKGVWLCGRKCFSLRLSLGSWLSPQFQCKRPRQMPLAAAAGRPQRLSSHTIQEHVEILGATARVNGRLTRQPIGSSRSSARGLGARLRRGETCLQTQTCSSTRGCMGRLSPRTLMSLSTSIF